MRKYVIATIGLLALLAACTSSSPAVPGSPSVAVPSLAGSSWVVTGITGANTLADNRPTLEFDGDRVSGNASCNRFNASYTQTGGELKVSPAAMTMMACSPAAVMSQEQAFAKALAAVAGVRAAGTGLELLDASGNIVLTLAPAPPEPAKPLEGTTWQLSGIIGSGTVSSPVVGTTVSLSIMDGELTGKACNTFRGTVEVSGDSFKAGPLMSTKMACAKAEEGAQETQVLKTLQAASSYAIDGSTLTLKAPDGSGLEFRAA